MSSPTTKRKREYRQSKELRVRRLYSLLLIAISDGAEAFMKAADESIIKNNDNVSFRVLLEEYGYTLPEADIEHLEWLLGWLAK